MRRNLRLARVRSAGPRSGPTRPLSRPPRMHRAAGEGRSACSAASRFVAFESLKKATPRTRRSFEPVRERLIGRAETAWIASAVQPASGGERAAARAFETLCAPGTGVGGRPEDALVAGPGAEPDLPDST